ncbi:hypothetical protein [Mycolicibacter minnesotensis]
MTRERQDFGQLAVFMATHDSLGKRLPKSQWHPIISDGRCGELYVGDSAGARELAADLLAAADAYDALVAEQ